MHMSKDDIRSLATRLFDSIEIGDAEGVADCYGPDLVVWHNFDGLEQSREDNLKTLAGLIARISDRRYTDRRLNVFDGGFVQQHVLTGVRKDGVRVSLPGVLVGAVQNGKITRLDEYLDSAQVAAFRVQV
jgi:ketosteroid isomerase-like protein